jgi:putative endonuclease
MYFAYVLYSPSSDRIYMGQTDNIEARLQRHNSGMVKSTKPFLPWELILTEGYGTRSEAMRRETELKSHKGRDFIRGLCSGR